MARSIFVLLPDKREKDTVITEGLNPALGRSRASTTGFILLSHSDRWPSAWWLRIRDAVDPQGVLQELHAIDWAFPALLAWRADDESRWSHELLGLHAPAAAESA
jgi:hypothetical protein